MPLSWLVCDFETASSQNLKVVGAHRYAQDPTTEILCFNFQEMGVGPIRSWRPGHFTDTELWDLAHNPNVTFIAHHADFEKAIWRELMVHDYRFPDIPDERWHDTMAVCAVKGLPQGLEEVLQVLGIEEAKDVEGSKFTIGLSRPSKSGEFNRTAEALARVSDYCDQDVRGEVALHQRLGWLPHGERRFWLLNQRLNQRGLRIDLDFVGAAQSVVQQASIPLIAEHRKITGLNPTQGKKLLAWLKSQGVPMRNLTKENVVEYLEEDIDATDDATMGMLREDDTEETEVEDEFEEAATEEEPVAKVALPDHVRRVLRIRQLVGSASVKKLKRMEQCVCADGRARGLLQFHGTGPGRSAGRLFQPLNFPRGTVKDAEGNPFKPQFLVDAIMSGDAEYVEMVTGSPPIEVVVSSLRYSIVPDPDRVFMSGDYSGIQARTVLALAGQHDKTALMAAGQDIYIDMAQLIYKCPVDKKRDVEKRQTGKNSVLGLGFQMGAAKFQLKYARKYPLSFCKMVVDTYRQDFAPEVPKLWTALETAAVTTVHEGTPHSAYGVEYAISDGWLTARLPSGRLLWYRNPRPTRRAMPWDAKDIRPSFMYQCQKMGRWATIEAYGGILTENVVMGIEVDIQRKGIWNCEKNGFPLVLEVYDEIVVEPKKEDADEKAFVQLMLEQDPWVKSLQIPIATETWVGNRYRK